jgi:DNA-binding NarL/FixJ family response regulator
MRLLIIDDHQTFSDMLAQYLENIGQETGSDQISVSTAACLAEAFDVIDGDHRPDLVILDLNLGGDDSGASTFRRFQERNTRDIPVAILTGMSFHDCNAAGIVWECYFVLRARGFLLKGGRLKHTFTGLSRILNGERYLPPEVIDLIQHPPAAASPASKSSPAQAIFTERQWSVAERIARGLRNKEIAREIDRSELYVRQIVSEVFRKLNVHTRTGLAIELLKLESAPE